jgi:hypothetical protein
MSKTHFRKVYKSDHLGTADLEEFLEDGKSLIFTISHVKQEYGTKVAGKKIDANIAYFKEDIKPLVLNATNSKIVRSFADTPFVEDWKNIHVELYIDENVKMKGMVVGGVRIKRVQPLLSKKDRSIDGARFDKLLAANKAGKYTTAKAQQAYDLTPEQLRQLV